MSEELSPEDKINTLATVAYMMKDVRIERETNKEEFILKVRIYR